MNARPGDLKVKDPSSVNEPFGMYWADWLANVGEDATIASSTWVITGPDELLEIEDNDLVLNDTQTQVFLSGGTVGAKYRVTNRITTDTTPAVVDDRSFFVLVQER